MKVYVITSGCYSEYMIEAVYTSKDMADAHIDIHPSHDMEEYELNPEIPKPPEGMYLWEVTMALDSDGVTIRKCDTPKVTQEARVDAHRGWITVRCMGRNEEHAVKIASEHRAVYLKEENYRQFANPVVKCPICTLLEYVTLNKDEIRPNIENRCHRCTTTYNVIDNLYHEPTRRAYRLIAKEQEEERVKRERDRKERLFQE